MCVYIYIYYIMYIYIYTHFLLISLCFFILLYSFGPFFLYTVRRHSFLWPSSFAREPFTTSWQRHIQTKNQTQLGIRHTLAAGHTGTASQKIAVSLLYGNHFQSGLLCLKAAWNHTGGKGMTYTIAESGVTKFIWWSAFTPSCSHDWGYHSLWAKVSALLYTSD